MSRPVRLALVIGVLGFAGVALLALVAKAAVMPSYLGAWLVLLAMPLGALSLVMGREAIGLSSWSPSMGVLRSLSGLMPLVVVLALPLLFRMHGLYPLLSTRPVGFAGTWMAPSFFAIRMVVFLLLWAGLALVFARPPAGPSGRRGLACIGLGLHIVIGTLAAVDWAMAVEPQFNSSAFGLLFLSAQTGMAAALMAILARPSRLRPVALLLSVLLGFWIFLQFTQYLVVWSANLPAEVLWYQHRSAGLGHTVQVIAVLLCVAILGMLLPRSAAPGPRLVMFAALAIVLLHGCEMLWLVTPAFREHFSVTLADILALAGMGGFGIAAVLLLEHRSTRMGGFRHGVA